MTRGFGSRELAGAVPVAGRAGSQMERNWVMDGRADPSIVQVLEDSRAIGHLNDIQMPTCVFPATVRGQPRSKDH